MSQSENERSAKTQPQAEASSTDRELSDAELETVAAAGDDPTKGDSSGGSGPQKRK